MAVSPPEEESNVSNPVNRIRWATRKLTVRGGGRKRRSIMDKLQNEAKRNSKSSQTDGSYRQGSADLEAGSVQNDTGNQRRRIYFNVPLPEDARDEDGRPSQSFGRNKVRTAKYTPISFIPKNLWYQFHNIANVYFLFLIILAIFPIFGASNPGLNAVPLIVILFVTAVKDGIEDWRRTVLDNELNNTPVHRLVDWENVNVSSDNISLWRRIKKATSRGLLLVFKMWKERGSKDEKVDGERGSDEPRASISTRRTRRTSTFYAHPTAGSTHSVDAHDNIQMTQIPSPDSPDHSRESNGTLVASEQPPKGDLIAADIQGPERNSIRFPARSYGTVIDPFKEVSGRARFKKDYWKNIQVGDFVRIYNDEPIPADVVILSTSDPDGACYVETKNLDGETNLKVRQALHCGRSIRHARDCERTEFAIESEPAQPNLYQYSGVVRWSQRDSKKAEAPTQEMAEAISINNLLLRGCNLRNTEWILGVAVFAGSETKIMLNSGITPSKRSRIQRELNWTVLWNFAILFFMCIVSGIVEGITWGQGGNSLDYFEYGNYASTAALDGFVTFWAAVILFQNMVPISLFITLEIIKTLQALFIYSDTSMYYEKIDYPCTPKSWNISDDLGQIEYIFSDKTGTLTQNVMEFKKCTINGIPYGEAYTEAQAGMRRREGVDTEEEAAKVQQQIAEDKIVMLENIRQLHNNPYLHDEDVTFIAPDFVSDLRGDTGEEQRQANERFMVALALCHTVITERTPGDPPKIEFKAQSPDEAALVSTARDCGFTVLGRADDKVILDVLGEERQYEVLNTLEFNSSRKRMSAIIRMPDGRIILFCKGADSMIYSRLKRGEQSELRQLTAEHLEMFAREGLRTLCIAERELTEDEYQNWNKEHILAAEAVQDREDKLEMVADTIERELFLLGGTAIEDRLQEGVPDTIALLGDAGIKLWVLTGDKVETAINIGFSCNLLNNDMDLIILKFEGDNLEDMAAAELDRHLSVFNMTGSDEELIAARKDHGAPGPTHAIVIDGDSLGVVLGDRLRQKFLLLCKQCRSVLCCRVSPSQKAAVVAMVKQGLDVMTLSVGDGANDVAMIQEADVGVGIAGEEGRQAVMSSDYAVGQFRYLQRLVLVHGRWSYRRLGETIANFFYKNIVWTFTLFWYSIYTNFDLSYLFDYTYILLYNLAFSSLPVICMGVLDQDVSDKVSLAVPQLYRRGIERKEWTPWKFWIYMLDGAYQSVICFFMAYLVFRPATSVTFNGLDISDRSRVGVYVCCAAVIVVNVYVLMNTYRWDWLMVLLVSISILLVWFWTGVFTTTTYSGSFYKAAPEVFGQLSFWALTLLTVIICLLPRFAAKAFQKLYMPYDVDVIREQIRQGKFDYLETYQASATPNKISSASSSEISKAIDPKSKQAQLDEAEDERPIYPPSTAPTGTTHNPRSQNGSDGTEYTGFTQSIDNPTRPSFDPTRPSCDRARPSLDRARPSYDRARPSYDRARPSFDRIRASMDRVRPSFEASNDFTSAALLARLESTQCATKRNSSSQAPR
ncbi:MAG: hypothetical protein M1834_005388 [Cirrosporium novae-zelandiae]|nr:MAG: hypothetical protein M1834_005388 [Cirrosporium novae-zelandiae]